MAIISGIKIFGSGAKPPVLEQLNATSNGTYTPSDGVDGFNPVNVNVQPPLQSKSVEITANGQSTIEADSEYYGLGSVGLNVNVQPSLQAKSTSTTITSNGTSTITLEPDSNYDGLSSASVGVNVNVPIPTFETEELVATANGTYTPSTNGYSKVRVNVSEPVSKYVVPNGIKFGLSKVFNPEDFDVSQVTDMSNMFYSCDLTSLDLSGLDTSSVTNMRQMFNGCGKLTSIGLSGLDTSNVTNMLGMFSGCSKLTSIDFSGLDTSNVENISSMFSYCGSLASIDLSGLNTGAITSMMEIFRNCKSLTSIDLSNWNVGNVINTSYMFNNCTNLQSLGLSNWDLSKVPNIYSIDSMFYNCPKLTDLNMNGAILPKINLTSWGLNYCPLTVDSLVSVLNALQQLDEGTSYTCTIGADNLAKLTDEQKAIATNKHWTLN